jgi:hypothetical protein
MSQTKHMSVTDARETVFFSRSGHDGTLRGWIELTIESRYLTDRRGRVMIDAGGRAPAAAHVKFAGEVAAPGAAGWKGRRCRRPRTSFASGATM